jgi:hypothetical protein
METIPIVLLHHDQLDILMKSVELIDARTDYPYKLFVVDNQSPQSKDLTAALLELTTKYRAEVIQNPKNNWIYGFNLAIEHSRWPTSSLYAFSDADIYVPKKVGGKCWLTYMVEQMNTHCCIGKLGLPLSVDNLKANPKLSESLSLQESYLEGPCIGENIVAPVDTTMALYRHDFFITPFKFQIGHGSLSKPQYYICRASKKLAAIHVGWDYYPNNGEKSYSIKRQWEKSVVMAKLGAYIAPELTEQFNYARRIYLQSMRLSVRALHSLKVSLLMFAYLLRRFPRSINEIQSRLR